MHIVKSTITRVEQYSIGIADDIGAEALVFMFLSADSLAGIFEATGIQDVRRYRYWDTEQRGVCVQKMMEDLEMAPEQSVIVLSASAHCPTGSDLSQKHWRLLTQLMVVLLHNPTVYTVFSNVTDVIHLTF